MVANIAGTVVGTSAITKAVGMAAKTAKTISKVAKVAQKSIKIAQKIAHMGTNIFAKGNQNGQTMTQEEADALAESTVDQAQGSLGLGDGEEAFMQALDMVEMVDPTGALTAAKAFMFPLCSKIH